MRRRRFTVFYLLIGIIVLVLLALFLRPSAEGEARRTVPQVLVTQVAFESKASSLSAQAINVRLSTLLPSNALLPKGRVLRYLYLTGFEAGTGRLVVTLFVPRSLLSKSEAQRVQLLGYSSKSWNSAQTALVKTSNEGYTFRTFPSAAEVYALVVKEEQRRR